MLTHFPASKIGMYTIKQKFSRYRTVTIPDESHGNVLKRLLISVQRYTKKFSAITRDRSWLSLPCFGRSESHTDTHIHIHTRHGTKRRRCHRRVCRMCSDAWAHRPAFWDADFTPTHVYSVVFCDKPASCTHLCARGIGRACREFTGQRWRLRMNACVHRVGSIEHKFPIFAEKKRRGEKSAIPKGIFWWDSQKVFQLKYSLSGTIGGIQHWSARSH